MGDVAEWSNAAALNPAEPIGSVRSNRTVSANPSNSAEDHCGRNSISSADALATARARVQIIRACQSFAGSCSSRSGRIYPRRPLRSIRLLERRGVCDPYQDALGSQCLL